MSSRSPRALLRATLLVTTVLALAPAGASAASLSIQVGPVDQYKSYAVTLSGTADRASYLYLFRKDDESTACPATAQGENQRAIALSPQPAGAGSYSASGRDTAPQVATTETYALCGYLATSMYDPPDAGATARVTVYGDSDSDGVSDDVDKCPNQYGKDETTGRTTADGCPKYDFDGDGVADTCPPNPTAAFTIVSVEQPSPGQEPVMKLDLPSKGKLTVKSDDGADPWTKDVAAAGRFSTGLPISAANYRKYSGDYGESKGTGYAGQAVTVNYSVTFTRPVPSQCKANRTAPDPATTQPVTYRYKPTPLKKVRFSISTVAPGHYETTARCTGLDKSVCRRYAGNWFKLEIPERTYYRLQGEGFKLPDDQLIDTHRIHGDKPAPVKNGYATYRLRAKVTRTLKRIPKFKTTFTTRFFFPVNITRTVTIRRGKFEDLVIVADNV
jgi:hypothetical protein